MQKKRKGRKIKHQTFSYKKKKSKALPVIITVLVLVAIVFIGYSVAEPLVNFFKGQISTQPSETETQATETTTAQTTETAETTEPIPQPIDAKNSLVIPEDRIVTSDYLATQIDFAIENGYSSITVPMVKDSGYFNYLTENEIVNMVVPMENVTLTAKEIYDQIFESGLIPVAQICVLKEHIVSTTNLDMTYTFELEGYRWIDDAVSNGGKSWLNPFSDVTIEYITEITKEITDAGFENVIFSDISFPYFRNSDIEKVGSFVGTPDRYEALVNLTNTVISALKTDESAFYICDTGINYIYGYSEIFKPDEVSEASYIAEIDDNFLEEGVVDNVLTYEQFEGKINELLEITSQVELLFMFNYDGLTANEILIIEEYITKNSLEDYFLINE